MSEDLSLREDVERELGWEPMIRSVEIGVAVKAGVVTLTGTVDSYSARRAAEEAAARVRGVKAVSSQLEVRPANATEWSDADIGWSAANILAWNALVPGGRVRVHVSHGHITLEGSVDWRFQRTAAADSVSDLTGVRGVTNLIIVSPTVPPEELKKEIEAALKRDMEPLARRIIVEVAHDRVKLWGSVNTWSEREAVEQAAWRVAGVHEISNHITVDSTLITAAGT